MIVARPINPKPGLTPAFGWLAAWLRLTGLTTPNPIHELRKLSGSLINSSAGLEAARRHLGHATIATTSASYLAPRSAVVDLAAKEAPPGEPPK